LSLWLNNYRFLRPLRVVCHERRVSSAALNYTRDGGRPFGFGNQVPISSHRKLLRSKAVVVSVAETPGRGSVFYEHLQINGKIDRPKRLFCLRRTLGDRAPSQKLNGHRASALPALVIPARRTVPPDECSLGTKPR
jgi:hypothetical protein